MRRLASLMVMALLACATARTPHDGTELADFALQHEIAARVAVDQEVQQELGRRIQAGQSLGTADYARRDSVFDTNLEWMRGILQRVGWPGRRLVGEEGSHGAWLLLQHADRDTALQRTALTLLERAVRSGDASPRDYAFLTDRVRVAEGRLQVYGTQLQYDSHGCASPRPTEAAADLDARRASVGLPPVAEYLHTTMVALGRAAQCEAQRR